MKPDAEPPEPPPELTWIVTTAGETFLTASVTADVSSRCTLLTAVPLVVEVSAADEPGFIKLVTATALKVPASMPTTSAITTIRIHGRDARGRAWMAVEGGV